MARLERMGVREAPSPAGRGEVGRVAGSAQIPMKIDMIVKVV